MLDSSWNPWKITAIGLALVIVTALITGLVVASWRGAAEKNVASAPTPPSQPAPQAAASRPVAPHSTTAPMVPMETAIAACNQYAAQQAGQRDKTLDVVKDTAVGAVVGAAAGAAGGAIAGGGQGAGKGAGIGGVLGAGALYGLNENKKNDQRYREAYAACMRAKGYTG